MFTKTNIMGLLGQVKEYFVQETLSTLYNSIIYDMPFVSGEIFQTFSLRQSDFTIQDLDELGSNHKGFVNYRYTQADQV